MSDPIKYPLMVKGTCIFDQTLRPLIVVKPGYFELTQLACDLLNTHFDTQNNHVMGSVSKRDPDLIEIIPLSEKG